ncbi:MAG: YolD-like family protein [Clostridia bacterium]|nr:YolD-like family protein [Clostridia bacterium]
MNKPKFKMSQAMRAKQFAPFAALKGFSEALIEKEKICVEKKELFEEDMCRINDALKTISRFDTVCVTYYHNKQYHELTGIAEKFDLSLKYIEIDNVHITFDDILQIEKIE